MLVKMTDRINNGLEWEVGDQIELAFDMNECHFFDKETEEAIG